MKARMFVALLLMAGGLTGCISGGKQFGYVTGPGTNEVFQFQLHADGSIAPLNAPTAGVGSSPVSILIHPSGLFAYIANFAGNNVTLLSVNKGNGELTVPASTNPIPPPTPPNIFNTGTGPIALAISPGGTFLFVLDQGSNDITVFTVDPGTGNLSPVKGSPFASGCSGSSLAVTPKGDLLFVACPALGVVNALSISSTGVLGTATPLLSGAGAAPSFVLVNPSGRFLYVADPPGNRVWGLALQGNGTANAISGSPFAAGAQPVAMTTNPQGSLLYVGNHGSNNVSAFVIDATTGALGAVSGSPFPTGGKGPSFLAASATSLYVTDQVTNDVAAFSIGSNGGLTAVAGSPINVATSPTWITLINE
jgi:6-phosphogluconolactonase